ncbi:retrovirus-related pol polyprotein from transposon TNT 1-94 [Tanacetum coccineum]
MKRVNTFVDMNLEVLKGSETRTGESSKRARDELESDKSKKQKIDEQVEAEKDDPKEEDMKNHIEIVQDEEEIAIDAIPLATKLPMIVEYKIVKEGQKGFYHLIRADGSSKRYSSMIRMLQGIDKEYLETLWQLVKEKHRINKPDDEYKRVLWGDMKGEYKMWKLRIEQYFQVQDYALWDIIENGNLFKPVARTTTNADGTSTSLIPDSEPEFEGYGHKISKSVSENVSNEVRKSPDAPLTNCNYHKKERVVFGSNYTRVNYNYSAQKAHPSAQRNMVPRAVLMKNGLRTLNTARPVNTAHPKTTVYSARPISCFSKSAQSTVKRPFYTRTTLTNKNLSQKVNTAKGNFYTARPKAVNTARPNTAVVNAVRENQVLLKVPRKNNMYNVDMKNIVPKESLTCLVANATLDESMLWHRRLGIKREFSIARTPQQNGVAERRNRTLIEAARTMLADSKLPTTFWAEVVNTACYVQNRVLVVKPHNKTPYELFRGRTPALSFMRPFGCHVTILNTLDHLGKFDGKSDDGFFVGYSLNSKDFRVYNIRTRKVEENLHVRFLEDKPIIAGAGPKWLFDIDVLTESMNYVPVVAGTNSNVSTDGSLFDSSSKNASNDEPQPSNDTRKKNDDSEIDNQERPNKEEPKKVIQALNDPSWIEAMQEELLQFKLQQVWTLVDLPYGKRAIGTKWTKNRLYEVFAPVARIEAIRLFLAYASFKDFVVCQMDVKSAFLYGKIKEEVYVCQPLGFEDPEFPDKVYKVEKALYGLHQAPRAWYETLSTYLLDNGFQRGQIDKTLFIKKIKGDILLVQVYVDDIIFGSTKKVLCTEFEKLMHKKFQMSSMGELTFFLGLQVTQKDDGIFISQDKYVEEILKKFGFSTVKTASTPMETSKPLLKDKEAEDVDVHLYRSMIGSLMYLTASRPDIMFAVCACARFQVTPKGSHLHVVKRIFRYLKGQPKLGLWKPKTTIDLKLILLISWQCKKQTIVATSTTKAEWVNKCVKKFNPYAQYGVEHWKNPHAKIFYIRKQKEPGKPKEEIYSNSKIIQVIKTYWELGHEHKFITEIVARRANDCIVSITEPDYKNLNKNDIEDIYLLIMNGKVPDYADTGLLWSLSVFIRSSVIWERVHDFQLGIESYQQKVNLTAPTITFLGIEEHDMFSIIYEPVHGIIYKNSKKEKRVMRHTEIHKFCDATLNRVLEGLKSYNNDVKYGYVQKDLTKDETEYLKLFEEEIEERLKHRRQMRRWEMYVNRRPLGLRRERPE